MLRKLTQVETSRVRGTNDNAKGLKWHHLKGCKRFEVLH